MAAWAPVVPGVEDVRKGLARRQHWITVRLFTVMRAGAVRCVVFVWEDWAWVIDRSKDRDRDRYSGKYNCILKL